MIKEDIDKAGTGNFYLAGNALQIQMLNNLFSQLARRQTELFRYSHDTVRLVITELHLRRLTNLRFAIGGRTRCYHCLTDFIGKKSQNIHRGTFVC